MRSVLLLVLCLPIASAAPVPKGREGKPDIELIQGQWRVVGRYDEGKFREGSQNEKCTWKFEGDTVFIDSTTNLGKFLLNPNVSPKHLDVTGTYGKYLSLYELNGDTLKWQNIGIGGERPIAMMGRGHTIIFARVKE